MARDEQKPITNDTEARLKALEEQNAKLMAALEAKWEAAQPAGAGIDAAQLETILTKVTKAAGQATEVLASKLKPENADHLEKSPFEHPEGGHKYPKAAIAPSREIIWGRPLTLTELTYAEVLALRELSQSLRRSERRLARDGKWKAIVSDDDQRVTISVPVKTIDDRQDLPPFLQIVQELTTGERTPDVSDVMAELTLLKAQLADLQAAHVAAV
jgi:hypothetical protein